MNVIKELQDRIEALERQMYSLGPVGLVYIPHWENPAPQEKPESPVVAASNSGTE